jgi:hypothetical protein
MVYKSINSLEDEIKEESPESGEEILRQGRIIKYIFGSVTKKVFNYRYFFFRSQGSTRKLLTLKVTIFLVFRAIFF